MGWTSSSQLSPKTLQARLSHLYDLSPIPGLFKALVGSGILIALIFAGIRAQSDWAFLGIAVFTGVFYAGLFLLTHDAIHRTLTGWKWFDEIYPRLLAYPILWYHGIYCELHKIHHKMNGKDIEDPERAHWTVEEYEKASSVGKWCIRQQWFLNIFVWGGFGFLFKHWVQAYKWYGRSARLRQAIWVDLAGIILVQGAINVVAIYTGTWWRCFIFFLVLERLIGAFHQFRSHVEHYGLWGKGEHPIDVQANCSRNILTNAYASFYMDHLNYHSVHHAFPKIPFYHLKEAHHILSEIYQKAGRPLVEESSYLKSAWQLATHPVLIRTSTEEVIPIKSD